MNIIILSASENSIPEWFLWFGIEAHKLITPLTGIISASWAIILLTKLKNTGKQRRQELIDLADQTSELRKITLSAQDQILELKNQTNHLKDTNNHLEKSVTYQSGLLEQFVESNHLKAIKEKINNRPHFDIWTNDNKNTPFESTIGFVNNGSLAENLKVYSGRLTPNKVKSEPFTQHQVHKTVSINIPLNITDQLDQFQIILEFEDISGNKYFQNCYGNWLSYSIEKITEVQS